MNLQELINWNTQTQTNNYDGGQSFNVLDSIDKENQSLKEDARKLLAQRFQDRSNLRKAIKSWEQTTGNKEQDRKTVRTSELSDVFTDAMVFLGKTPEYMQETYWSSEWNIDLINKVKQLQNGKYSWDIQNYIDWKSDNLTWLVNNIFPTYVSWWMPKSDTVSDGYDPLKDTRSTWEKLSQDAVNWQVWWFKPVWDTVNLVAWVVDDIAKVWPWLTDLVWITDNAVWWVDSLKWNNWFNLVDEESWAFNIWELGSEIWQQVLLDKWLTSMFTKGAELYKWYKALKNTSKWTELAVKWWTELARGGTELATTTTDLAVQDGKIAKEMSKPENVKWIKDTANKIYNRFKKEWTAQNIAKDWLRWAKDATEFQFIEDVHEWELSPVKQYWLNAWIWMVLWTMFWTTKEAWWKIIEPREQLQTSLKRITTEDTDDILRWAEEWAKDATKPSALHQVTDQAIKEAKENATKIRDEAWSKLWEFRKTLPNKADANIETDLINPLNESITKKWIWGKIVFEDWVARVEWYPWEYKQALEAIADKINAIKNNLENKASIKAKWWEIEIPSSTEIYEEILQDLKRVSYNETDNAVKRNILDIQKDMIDWLKKQMSEAQFTEYEDLLKKYSDAATRVSKIEQAENMMMNRNVMNQWKFDDWTYLNDFLKELEKDEIISKNAADRRIAAVYSDAFYGWPIKDTDRLIYPSVPWLIEWIMKMWVQTLSNPKWVLKLGGGWKKYNTNYKPNKIEKAASVWADAMLWKWATKMSESD